MRVAGIDEAGRGCVVGPLVVAGLLVKEEKLREIADIGVKDSKLLSAKKREALYPEIIKIAEKYIITKVTPQQIDCAVESKVKLHKLNFLEAKTMGEIVTLLEPNIVYVDAADVSAERFAQNIQETSVFQTKIVSEHKADKTYPIVSAASILAKVERDNTIALLRNEYGDFGSGYLSDPKTQAFLVDWLKTHQDYPEIIRKSWKPAKEAKNQQHQKQQKLF
ncbi:MAG: ribonuclease HII [Crenarchaeota archaeon]|nr:ribonuclease HII [Thermoproteota archaeon]